MKRADSLQKLFWRCTFFEELDKGRMKKHRIGNELEVVKKLN